MIRNFLKYIEIKTKITSIFAFFFTLAFLFYKKQPINLKLTLIFFAAMFLFDLTTTAINNYIDTKTNDQVLQFQRRNALIIIVILFTLSTAFGLYLAYLTDIVVLIAGILCFFCGVFYTGGPIPISRQPWGEILSGVFYGFFIPFLLLYINMPKETFIIFNVSAESTYILFKNFPILTLILFSITPVLTTANIMLANNICDLKKDVKVKRFTLPYYLGETSLYLFAGIYYLTYIALIAMVTLKILSPICLISLLTIIFVNKNIKIFFKKQDKATTFIVSIKNYIIIMGVNTIMIFLSGFFS